MNIGPQIKARREQLGLTQAEASARMDRSQSYWADLEADRRSPTERTLERVAAALGCRLSIKIVPKKDVRYDTSRRKSPRKSHYASVGEKSSQTGATSG